MKVAVITPIPTPYRDPFWNEVAAQPEIDLHVYYCSRGRGGRPWKPSWPVKFEADFTPAYNLTRFIAPGGACYYNPAAIHHLKSTKYDAMVVGGYNHATMLSAIFYARRSNTPYFLMNEVYLAQPRAAWRKMVKLPLVRSIVRHAAGYFPTGTLSGEYLVHYGASPSALYPLPNTPDVDALWRDAQRMIGEQASIRRQLGLDEKPVIMFVSRLIQLKRVDLLLEAVRPLLARDEATVVILGDGPMREAWQSLAEQLGVASRVRFEGFVQPDELPRWYAVADLFVLPSVDETWSVVVLESLASGVPVVITDLVGCYADMVNSPEVGEVVPAGDAEAMGAAIHRRLQQPRTRQQVADAWEPVRRELAYPVLARRFVRALEQHTEGGSNCRTGAA